MCYSIENAKINDLITPMKNRDTNSLVNLIAYHVSNKIKAIPTPISDTNDTIK